VRRQRASQQRVREISEKEGRGRRDKDQSKSESGLNSWLVGAPHIFEKARDVCELGRFRCDGVSVFREKFGYLGRGCSESQQRMRQG